MRASVLGPFELMCNDRVHTPKTPKVRSVLALLMLSANETVSTRSLIEELWGERIPRSATGTLQTYIYQLRKLLCRIGEGVELQTKPPGYHLRIPAAQVDARRFEELASAGQAAMQQDDFAHAGRLLRQALALWRGRALSGVECGQQLGAYATHLEEARLMVLEQRIEADLRLGRHRELVSELKALVATYPLHEWFYSRLIIALCLSGRRYEALDVYHELRRRLREELGLDPSIELQQIHRSVLVGGVTGTVYPRSAPFDGGNMSAKGLVRYASP